MIQRISNEGQTKTTKAQPAMRGKVVDKKHVKDKIIAAVEDTYEFRRTARHEIKDKSYYAHWDEKGRFFMIQGRKNLSFDKSMKQIKIYNMFGELIEQHTDLQGLDRCHFRPRPDDILNANQIKKLKKTYKTDYEKLFKEEESEEKKVQSDIVKDQRKKVRDDFLDNFFLPLRKRYEQDIEKYKALFPIKEGDISEKQEEFTSIFHYGEVVSTRQLELHPTN